MNGGGATADNPRVAVIGAGSWGTALASVLASKCPTVTLWCLEQEVADGINQTHKNPVYISDLPLPENIQAETDLEKVASSHDILVMVIPTQFTRGVLQKIAPLVGPEVILVSASKGVEVATLTLISQIYEEVLGPERGLGTCYLSGPSFAREVILRHPTAVAIAGQNIARVKQIQALFSTPFFRTYSTEDVVGVELGGALKNVIALAAGISDGLGLGSSARAALITRGLSEIIRLGVRLGACPETFSGLSGLGDLLLTATTDLSRNRTVGKRLGKGESLEEIQKGSREVAEGVKTTYSVHHLAQKLGVEMPITAAVYAIVHEGRTPKSVVTELMERDLKPENEI
ncbi:MAG: NAD(P)-dependent glycerol-3-phosphate dehydrogenase [Magnetococcales bacterium]|nr:NAD(P)-dependent glycerol-3-phosphate dehydrogenase [Magnetococcales bacterium]